jgi:hypothetical protein
LPMGQPIQPVQPGQPGQLANRIVTRKNWWRVSILEFSGNWLANHNNLFFFMLEFYLVINVILFWSLHRPRQQQQVKSIAWLRHNFHFVVDFISCRYTVYPCRENDSCHRPRPQLLPASSNNKEGSNKQQVACPSNSGLKFASLNSFALNRERNTYHVSFWETTQTRPIGSSTRVKSCGFLSCSVGSEIIFWIPRI